MTKTEVKKEIKIFFIAPLSSNEQHIPNFLAAHKKIYFLLDALHRQGVELVFINSGAAMVGKQAALASELTLHSGKSIPYIRPSTFSNAKLGRVKNLIDAPKILDHAIEKYGSPDLLWCYNGYAYEMHTAKYALDKYGIKSILEFEDWHFARSNVTNPKALLDWLFWRRAAPGIGYSFAVNKFLKNKMDGYGVSTSFLPAVVSDSILNLSKASQPFRNGPIAAVKCGYFGGLNHEKGGTFLLDLITTAISKKLPLRWTITGNGELSSEFSNIAKKNPLQISFHGTVDELTLQSLIGSVDVILNPHLPNNGVFPFKVMEAVASGRLVLSSPLQIAHEMNWLLSSLVIVPLDLDKWVKQLLNAWHQYQTKYFDIEVASTHIRTTYSGMGLKNKIMSAVYQTRPKNIPN